MYPYLTQLVFFHGLTGTLAESQLSNAVVELHHLLCKFLRRTDKETTQHGCEQRLFLPSKGGDQVVEVDLCEDVELGRHGEKEMRMQNDELFGFHGEFQGIARIV